MDTHRSGGDGQPVSITTRSSVQRAQPQRNFHLVSDRNEQILHNPHATVHAASRSQESGQAQLQQGYHPCDDHEENLPIHHHSSDPIIISPSQQQQNPRRHLDGKAVIASIEASLADDDNHRAITPSMHHDTMLVPARMQSVESMKRKSGFDHVLAAMIREEEQCKVQQLGEPKHQARSNCYRDFLHMDEEDYEMLGLVRTLEADCQMTSRTESECMPAPRETFRLSTSRQPLGVSKNRTLQYRTSGEAGLNCRALKRSMPRMRRRPKSTLPETKSPAGHEDSTTRPGTATSVA